ncbi:hypothetical protein ACIFOC_00406 [Leucobacter aridicollis]
MRPETGQVWRRKKDGQEVTVIGVPDRGPYGYVAHQGKRRNYTSLAGFLSKYEFVREAVR